MYLNDLFSVSHKFKFYFSHSHCHSLTGLLVRICLLTVTITEGENIFKYLLLKRGQHSPAYNGQFYSINAFLVPVTPPSDGRNALHNIRVNSAGL